MSENIDAQEAHKETEMEKVIVGGVAMDANKYKRVQEISDSQKAITATIIYILGLIAGIVAGLPGTFRAISSWLAIALAPFAMLLALLGFILAPKPDIIKKNNWTHLSVMPIVVVAVALFAYIMSPQLRFATWLILYYVMS